MINLILDLELISELQLIHYNFCYDLFLLKVHISCQQKFRLRQVESFHSVIREQQSMNQMMKHNRKRAFCFVYVFIALSSFRSSHIASSPLNTCKRVFLLSFYSLSGIDFSRRAGLISRFNLCVSDVEMDEKGR